MFRIAIIGRPNVGKSTLFNKLVGKSFALTDDTPGVTRDRKEAQGKLGPLEFVAIDTAGLEKKINKESLQQRMFEQTALAVDDADLCLFVVDGKAGVIADDVFFASWLRKLGKKVVLIANKCENFNESHNFAPEFFRFGFGLPVAISAEHKLGFGELYDHISVHFEEYEKLFESLKEQESDENEILKEESEEQKIPQIAVIGRPNAGKSTFLNQILGKERFITGHEAGITRDAISTDCEFNGQKLRLIDTAGIRKKSNITDKLEKLSTHDSYRAMRFASIVILLIDANFVLDNQDLALAGQVLREGRVLVFGINKIDEVKIDKEQFMKQVRSQIQQILPEISGSPIVGISAKSGYNMKKILEMSLTAYQQWQTYLTTSQLNSWLQQAVSNTPPPLYKGHSIRLKFITQIKRRPPTFLAFCNHPDALKDSYRRFLVNSLRDSFDLKFTPIRFSFKKSENPFEGRKEKSFSKKLHRS